MKVAGLVFSARKSGSGFNCIRYCLERFEQKGFKTALVNAFDYEIKPCSHCNYECYAEEIRGKREECPVKDDVPKLFELTKDADMLLFAVPCYGGHVPAIYRAWTERVPHLPELNKLFKNFEEFQRLFLNKIQGIIVIGNLTAWGDMALHEVLADFYNTEQPETILLQPREFGGSSLKGDLIEVQAVKERLEGFVELLKKRTAKKRKKE